MGHNEYKGRRMSITLDQEIYALLEQDSKRSCLKPSTRVAQIVSQFLMGELNVQSTIQSAPLVQVQEQVKPQVQEPVVPVVVKQQEEVKAEPVQDEVLDKKTKLKSNSFQRKQSNK